MSRKHITEDQKIHVVRRENPFADGSEAAKRVAIVLAANGKTVASAKGRGARQSTVAYCVRSRLIKVA